jgi:DNA-nicking Smr family endonuclease
MKPRNLKHLSDLGELKNRLKQAQQQALEVAQRKREQRALEERARNLFALTIANTLGAVVKMHSSPAASGKPRPLPNARQRELDETAVMLEAISDEFDVESLLETDDNLSYRSEGIGPEVVRKLRRGVWVIQAELDLHGARRDQARERLSHFIHNTQASGLRCVRIIHGKGNGSPGHEPVLKGKVKSWLAQKKEVLAYTQARGSDGGAGALVVLLGGKVRRAGLRKA